jgi:uncharacterized damage-inducible protein DinB
VASTADLLVDAFERVRATVHRAVDGLDAEQLRFRVDSDANSIGWLVWHLTRVQDDHVAGAAELEQVWLADGWCDRFGLPFPRPAIGYGHSSDDVAAVQAESPELLLGYHDAVHDQTVRYVRRLEDGDLDRIVDEAWDPPVTLAVRLVSVVNDDLQHAGQAAFVRGIVSRLR